MLFNDFNIQFAPVPSMPTALGIYRCHCPPNCIGINYQTLNVCMPNPCLNNGTCTMLSLNTISCACPPTHMDAIDVIVIYDIHLQIFKNCYQTFPSMNDQYQFFPIYPHYSFLNCCVVSQRKNFPLFFSLLILIPFFFF